jgi:hypothetical protein
MWDAAELLALRAALTKPGAPARDRCFIVAALRVRIRGDMLAVEVLHEPCGSG